MIEGRVEGALRITRVKEGVPAGEVGKGKVSCKPGGEQVPRRVPGLQLIRAKKGDKDKNKTVCLYGQESQYCISVLLYR